MLTESEQDTVYKIISHGQSNGSLKNLEDLVQATETELLQELDQNHNVAKKDEDLIFNAGVCFSLLGPQAHVHRQQRKERGGRQHTCKATRLFGSFDNADFEPTNDDQLRAYLRHPNAGSDETEHIGFRQQVDLSDVGNRTSRYLQTATRWSAAV